MSDNNYPFQVEDEAAIISLIIDFPELYSGISRFVTPDVFQGLTSKYVMNEIYKDFEKHGSIPSRKLLDSRMKKLLTAEDPHKEVLALVNRESDPREIPFLRDTLHDWVEDKTYGLLYGPEAEAAYQRKDFDFLRKIFDEASMIRHSGSQGFWFFDQIDELFVENAVDHLTTGFQELDQMLNEGGPSPGEVVVWMASTGVGKSIMLCNQAVTGVINGKNVLFITFELSTIKTALRIGANLFNTHLDKFKDSQDKIRRRAKLNKNSDRGDLVIYDLPPDEHSVDSVYAIIDNLKKTKGWKPDIVILDYLELMISRRKSMNDGDYSKQKSVGTEIRGLARNEKVLVHTATQTNRSGVRSNNQRSEGQGQDATNGLIDLDQAAESYGKNMAVDYVISLNQSMDEYRDDRPRIVLFVAKNRNGPKFGIVEVDISYGLMKFKELQDTR